MISLLPLGTPPLPVHLISENLADGVCDSFYLLKGAMFNELRIRCQRYIQKISSHKPIISVKTPVLEFVQLLQKYVHESKS